MTFLILLFYVMLTYLSPAEMIPSLAPFKPMLILSTIGLIAALATIPLNPIPWTSLQVPILTLFIFAILISRAFTGWIGGVPVAFMGFMPAAACFYLAIGALDSIAKLRVLTLGLLLAALYLVAMGAFAYYGILPDERFLLVQYLNVDAIGIEKQELIRIKALGFMDDPNDLAQFLVTILPLLWLWKGNAVWNFVSILFPSLVLLFGVYLTRSRGAVVGLAVILLLAFRRRLGTVASTVLTGIMGLGFLALGFTGGRSISVSSGSDRLALWSDGIGMFKSSPVWGVGFRAYADFTGGLTAHNSLLQCLAETGLLGYSPWIALLIVNFYYLRQLTTPDAAPLLQPSLLNAARMLSLSYYGFLATAWFLSRAYIPTLYLLLGITVALHHIAARQNPNFQPYRFPRALWVQTATTVVGSIGLFYVLVNLRL